MTSNHSISELPSASIRRDVSATTQAPTRDLYAMSHLLKRMRGRRTSTYSLSFIKQRQQRGGSRIGRFVPVNIVRQQSVSDTSDEHPKHPANRSKFRGNNDIDHLDENRKRPRKRRQRLSRSVTQERQKFNHEAYCVAYCTIIILGVTGGGWIGGLFELMSGGHDGCDNENHGNFMCKANYSHLNVIVRCINIFYTDTMSNNLPYVCLCRSLENPNGKFRACEFLHAEIHHIDSSFLSYVQR